MRVRGGAANAGKHGKAVQCDGVDSTTANGPRMPRAAFTHFTFGLFCFKVVRARRRRAQDGICVHGVAYFDPFTARQLASRSRLEGSRPVGSPCASNPPASSTMVKALKVRPSGPGHHTSLNDLGDPVLNLNLVGLGDAIMVVWCSTVCHGSVLCTARCQQTGQQITLTRTERAIYTQFLNYYAINEKK